MYSTHNWGTDWDAPPKLLVSWALIYCKLNHETLLQNGSLSNKGNHSLLVDLVHLTGGWWFEWTPGIPRVHEHLLGQPIVFPIKWYKYIYIYIKSVDFPWANFPVHMRWTCDCLMSAPAGSLTTAVPRANPVGCSSNRPETVCRAQLSLAFIFWKTDGFDPLVGQAVSAPPFVAGWTNLFERELCALLRPGSPEDANDLPLDHFQEDMNRGLQLGMVSVA